MTELANSNNVASILLLTVVGCAFCLWGLTRDGSGFGTKLFSLFLLVVYFFPYPFLIVFTTDAWHKGYYLPDYLPCAIWATAFASTFSIAAWILEKITVEPRQRINPNQKVDYSSVAGIAVACICLLVLLLRRSPGFSDGDYGENLESRAGDGLFGIGAMLFCPMSICWYLEKISRIRFTIVLLSVALYGSAIFIFTGGQRNMMAASIFGVMLVGYRCGHLRMRTIAACFILGVMSLQAMAFYRYSGQLSQSEFSDRAINFFLDSFAPIDSFMRIHDYYYSSGYREHEGVGMIGAFFQALVPRAVWPEKPLFQMTGARFYTDTILQYSYGINMAPTLLGTFVIMTGKLWIPVWSLPVAILCRGVDQLAASNDRMNIAVAYSVGPAVFFMARDGLEYFLFRFAVVYVSVICFSVCWKLVFGISTARATAFIRVRSI